MKNKNLTIFIAAGTKLLFNPNESISATKSNIGCFNDNKWQYISQNFLLSVFLASIRGIKSKCNFFFNLFIDGYILILMLLSSSSEFDISEDFDSDFDEFRLLKLDLLLSWSISSWLFKVSFLFWVVIWFKLFELFKLSSILLLLINRSFVFLEIFIILFFSLVFLFPFKELFWFLECSFLLFLFLFFLRLSNKTSEFFKLFFKLSLLFFSFCSDVKLFTNFILLILLLFFFLDLLFEFFNFSSIFSSLSSIKGLFEFFILSFFCILFPEVLLLNILGIFIILLSSKLLSIIILLESFE